MIVNKYDRTVLFLFSLFSNNNSENEIEGCSYEILTCGFKKFVVYVDGYHEGLHRCILLQHNAVRCYDVLRFGVIPNFLVNQV